MSSKELLRRIDERDYLTEREHREFLDRLNKDLEEKELLESELKLEKHKVKYVMEQLKKQDEILEILKQLAKGVIELKNNNIDITKYVVLISESTNDKIKNWLEKRDK